MVAVVAVVAVVTVVAVVAVVAVPLSFLHFWLGNVLRATTARTFSTSQLPKVF